MEIEWPPQLPCYRKIKLELTEAIEQHEHFGEWLLERYEITLFNNNKDIKIKNHQLLLDINNLNFSINELKKIYCKEQKKILYEHIITISLLELQLKNTILTKEDKEKEELYYNQKKEYDKFLEEQNRYSHLVNHKKNLKLLEVKKPEKNILRDSIALLIEEKIKNYDKLIYNIYKKNKIDDYVYFM